MIRRKFRDYRLPLTLKFCLGVTSLVSGIFLISLLLYHYLGPRHWPNDFELVFQRELFHPEIFIPEMIILFIMGFLILHMLKWQVKKENDNEKVQTLLLWYSIWAFIFIILFIPGFIIAHDFFGRYSLLGSGFGIVALIVVSISSIFIILYLRKIGKDKLQKEQKDKQLRKLLNNRVLNYDFIMIFMFGLALVSLFVFFILEEVTPYTSYRITWEEEFNEDRLGLPGTNLTINMTVEIIEGPGAIGVSIVENENRSWNNRNWNVSPQTVVVRHNEVKTITFTCTIPQNAPENSFYSYSGSLIDFEELQPISSTGTSIECTVTHDIDEYNEAQSRLESSSSLWRTGGATQISISMQMIELAIILLFADIIITAFFKWNKFVSIY